MMPACASPVRHAFITFVAAAAAGIKRVMLPARNKRDYDDIPEEVRKSLEFIWLERVDDAVAQGLQA